MERWSWRVAAFLQRMNRDRTATADLSQETFVKLYQSRSRYRPAENFSPSFSPSPEISRAIMRTGRPAILRFL